MITQNFQTVTRFIILKQVVKYLFSYLKIQKFKYKNKKINQILIKKIITKCISQ